jgi:hypothetical protein
MSGELGIWISVTINIIFLVEKIYSWTPKAKQKLQPVEVLPIHPNDRLRKPSLKVPWHQVRFDKSRKRYVVPKFGTTSLTAEQVENAKKSNSGWIMMECSAVMDPEPFYHPTETVPL